MKLNSYALLSATVLVAVLAGCGSDAATSTTAATDAGKTDTAAGPHVHLRGVAYRFAPDAKEVVANATITVAELPGVTTTTDAQGHYDLTVPKGATVTPQITATGYHAMTLQTFAKVDTDLENVHFQTPDDSIFVVLSQIVGATLDDKHCIIASTANTKAIQGLSYEQFRAFGAHGVADATASGTPALPPTIYFDANTVPDAKLTATTLDGGVLWTNVLPGVYTISATHPTKKFASFTATCVGGRLINANPPWGLKEL